MRYFTRGWACGDLTDDETTAVEEAYNRRRREIRPRLPVAMVRLAEEVSLHDAVIEQIRWHERDKVLDVRFAAITPDERYQTVTLVYRGAMLGRDRMDSLRRLARDRDAELLYDEVDLDDKEQTLIHRLLFHPCEEVTIDFTELELTLEPREDLSVRLAPAFLDVDDCT